MNRQPPTPSQPLLIDACKLALSRAGFGVSAIFDPTINQYRVRGSRNSDEYPFFCVVGKTLEEAYVRGCLAVKINP